MRNKLFMVAGLFIAATNFAAEYGSNYGILPGYDFLVTNLNNQDKEKNSPKTISALEDACKKNNVQAIQQYISDTPELSSWDVGKTIAFITLNEACQKALSDRFPMALEDYFGKGRTYKLDDISQYLNNGFIILWQRRDSHPFSRIPMLHYLTQYRKVKKNNGKEELDKPDYKSIELLLQAGANPYYKHEDLYLEGVIKDNFVDAFDYADNLNNEEEKITLKELLRKYPRDPHNTKELMIKKVKG